jgi:hypothetical protein
LEISDFIWNDEFLWHIEKKHNVQRYEIREVFANNPQFRKSKKGDRPGEDVYLAHGKTDAGRYLRVVFIYKKDGRALVLTAYKI